MDDSATFDSLVGGLEYPMFIVTARAGEERLGCLVGFATQTSIDPPRFLVCISDKNLTYRVARTAEAMAVHLVPADRTDLAELFGGETGDDADKFSAAEWRRGPDGVPVITACPTWFAGTILDRIPLGDHVGFLLHPYGGNDMNDDPLGFQRARRIDPGHEA